MRFLFLIFISLFILIASSSFCFSKTVTPNYIQVKETGSESLPSLDPAMSIDCDNKNIILVVSDFRSNLPVPNAQAYLFNTNYGYSFLYRNSTDDSGRSSIHALGNLNFLTALFILRIDAGGYRTKEVEFTFAKCFEPTESRPDPEPQNTEPSPNPAPQPEPVAPPIPQPAPVPTFTGPSMVTVGFPATFNVTNCNECSVSVEGPNGTNVLSVDNNQITILATIGGSYRLSLVRNGEVVSRLSMETSAGPSPLPPSTSSTGVCGLPLGLIILPLIYSLCESKKTLSVK